MSNHDDTEHTEFNARDVIGGYRIVRHLATGGQSDVYELEGGDLLLKQLAEHLRHHPQFREQSSRRGHQDRVGRHLERFDGVRGVEQLVEQGVDELGEPYHVVKRAPGVRLDEWIAAQRGPRAATRIARVAARCAENVATVHAAGVVHRDLREGNIIVDGAGGVTIIDFAASLDHNTVCGDADLGWGPPSALAAPERRGGARYHASPATDVWELSATLIRCIDRATGLDPAAQSQLLSVLRNVVGLGEAERPSAAVLATRLQALVGAETRAVAVGERSGTDAPLRRATTAVASRSAAPSSLGGGSHRHRWSWALAIGATGLVLQALLLWQSLHRGQQVSVVAIPPQSAPAPLPTAARPGSAPSPAAPPRVAADLTDDAAPQMVALPAAAPPPVEPAGGGGPAGCLTRVVTGEDGSRRVVPCDPLLFAR